MEVLETNIKEYPLLARGKVRDIYDLDDKLLIVATDRISAFDCIMQNGIPRRGTILTQMSIYWFNFISDIIKNHLIAHEIKDFPEDLQKYSEQLEERSMIVKKAERINLECIVRGYITGSGWKDYNKTGAICGIKLPKDLKLSDKLPEPIFTPSTKAETGHDINVSVEEAANIVGKETAEKIKNVSLNIYKKAAEYAESKGIIIADTKFEFGFVDGELIIIDECLSPDSSRFWPKNDYEPGKEQQSFDKQYIRNYLESTDWNKEPPAPTLPMDIVGKSLDRYKEAFERLCK